MSVDLDLGLVFVCLFPFLCILCIFVCFSLNYFVLVLFAFVVFVLVS